MFILFIFNSVIFSTGNYITPAFIFSYIDELSTFFEFGWGDAAFRFSYRELDNQASKLYLDGCTAGLMAWFYERVPSLTVSRGVHICPRLFRFEKSKIKLDAVKAEVAFDVISSTKLLLPVSKEQGGSRDNCELEKIVNKQIAEIKMLKRTCAQLKRERVGAKRRLFDLKENLDLEKEFARNRKGKDIVVDNDLSVDDAADGMNETDEQEELSASHDLLGNLNDFVDVPVNNCVDLSENLNAEGEVVQKLVETKISDIGELKKGKDVCADGLGKGKGVAGIEFEMKESIGVDDLGDGKGVVGAELGRDKNEESGDMGMKKSKADGENSLNGSCDGSSEDLNEIDKLLDNIVTKVVKENNVSAGDISTNVVESRIDEDTSDKSGGVDETDDNSEKVEEIINFQSSIVDNVRTRGDRVKKRKPSMFVTPPSTTPKRKGRKKANKVIDVEELPDNDLSKAWTGEYQGRTDFCGHEEATDEEKKLLKEYLLSDDIAVDVWLDGIVHLPGSIFCDFLFGNLVSHEIINVQMRMMEKFSVDNGNEIFCMDTLVQAELFEHLKKFGKKMKSALVSASVSRKERGVQNVEFTSRFVQPRGM
ncbi:uncharacterized protein [Henckelia pumila]|uniref:uncharacterized protein n=1 Tax=Henckelia pumila TaxID=405737 RepID=UPI003C6E5B9F